MNLNSNQILRFRHVPFETASPAAVVLYLVLLGVCFRTFLTTLNILGARFVVTTKTT
jgi:hypothetical protein